MDSTTFLVPANQRSFHLFPRLAVELRRMVYKHAGIPRRLIKFRRHDEDKNYNYRPDSTSFEGNGFSATTQPFGLLHAWKESREFVLELLEREQKAFSVPLGIPISFNPPSDVVLFSSIQRTCSFRWPTSDYLIASEGIQNVASENYGELLTGWGGIWTLLQIVRKFKTLKNVYIIAPKDEKEEAAKQFAEMLKSYNAFNDNQERQMTNYETRTGNARPSYSLYSIPVLFLVTLEELKATCS